VVQGAYLQWIRKEHPEARKYLLVIDIILENTFQYKKRFGFINTKVFDSHMSASTRKRHVTALKNLGLLEYQQTSKNNSFGYTRYQLVLPEEIENNTQWVKSRAPTEETKKTKTTADTGSVL